MSEQDHIQTVSFEDFKKLDLKVARILQVKEHPDADKLLLLEIDNGSEKKQIIAGIKGCYTPGSLEGRLIVIVDNLDPVDLRGERSNGMLLAARGPEGDPVLLAPEVPVPPGSRIS
jgi:methionyl-tRNA synthetase